MGRNCFFSAPELHTMATGLCLADLHQSGGKDHSSGPTGFLSDLIKCLGWICLAVEQLQCCHIGLQVLG